MAYNIRDSTGQLSSMTETVIRFSGKECYLFAEVETSNKFSPSNKFVKFYYISFKFEGDKIHMYVVLRNKMMVTLKGGDS